MQLKSRSNGVRSVNDFFELGNNHLINRNRLLNKSKEKYFEIVETNIADYLHASNYALNQQKKRQPIIDYLLPLTLKHEYSLFSQRLLW